MPIPHSKIKIPPAPAKVIRKIEIKLPSQCAIPHENQSPPQILSEWLQPKPAHQSS